MALKDIEKLKEKFEKDPNSKLFLPLAEEYRKESLLDAAIEVLNAGLEKHPAYTSARVLLGKIYYEKGMLLEARAEFENVIASVPDNLFAHKKLAEIYRDTGDKGRAITVLQAILRLNPMDEETLISLKALESGAIPGSEQDQAAAAETHYELRMPEETRSESVSHGQRGEETVSEVEEVQAEHVEEELTAFKAPLFGDKDALHNDAEPEARVEEQPVHEITIKDETPDVAEEDFTFGDVATEGGHEEIPPSVDVDAEIEHAGPAADVREELPEADVAMLRRESTGARLEDAERCIAEERYSDAMGIYRRCFAAAPDNKVVLQRINELRALLKLLGRDKEELIVKLDAFLEGIQKRRDEFLGRS